MEDSKKTYSEKEVDAIIRKELKSRVYLIKKDPEFLNITRQFAIDFRRECENSLSVTDQVSRLEKLLENLDSKKLTGCIQKTSISVMRIARENYDVFPGGRLYKRRICNCKICNGIITDDSKNGKKTWCSKECRAILLKQKRDKKRGIQGDVEIHRTCIVCGKELTKRLGAKTCSDSCRKKLSLMKK